MPVLQLRLSRTPTSSSNSPPRQTRMPQDAGMPDPVTQPPPPAPTPAAVAPATPAKSRRRRWPKALAGLLALLLLGVWFAPTVVAKTGLRNRIARQAAADLNGSLDVGGASLGWLSTIGLRDVTLTDREGRVVARIPKVTSSKSLLAILRDRSGLGEFTFHSPAVEVVCEKNSTNLED